MMNNKVLSFLAFAFAMSLPFANGINNIILGLFYSVVVILVISKQLCYQKDNVPLLLGSTILLILPVFWSFVLVDDFTPVVTALTRRLSFVLSPIAFLFISKEGLYQIRKNSLKGLVYGGLLSSFFLIITVFGKFFSKRPSFTIDENLFNYFHTGYNYTNAIGIHPSYIGMYILFGFIVLLFTNLFRNRFFTFISFGVLSLSILFINSRIIQILYFLVLALFFFKLYFHLIKRKYLAFIYILGTSLLVIFLFTNLFGNTYLYQRLTDELVWELSYEVGTNYNSFGKGDSRMARWNAAIQVIKDRPLFGYGVSMEAGVLSKQYTEMEMHIAAEERYNSHNQYLGYTIEGGLIALALLCFYLCYSLVFAVKKQSLIFILFFIAIGTICLVENYLVRNAGITFVSFFGAVFLFSDSEKSKLNDLN